MKNIKFSYLTEKTMLINIKIPWRSVQQNTNSKTSMTDRTVVFREDNVPTFSNIIFHYTEQWKEVYCENSVRKLKFNEKNEGITVSIRRCWNCYNCYKFSKKWKLSLTCNRSPAAWNQIAVARLESLLSALKRQCTATVWVI